MIPILLAVLGSSVPEPFSAEWYDQRCRIEGAVCPAHVRECEPMRKLGEERIRPENEDCRR